MPSDTFDKAVQWDCSKQSRVKPLNSLSNIPEHTHYSDCNERGARVDLFAYNNTLIGNWLGRTCIVLRFTAKQNWARRTSLVYSIPQGSYRCYILN